MKIVLRTMAAASVLVVTLALGLAGCNSAAPTDAARTALGIGFTVYADGYQPVLKFYSSLPECGNPAQPPCKDKALYKKLYDADAAVAKCSAAAQASIASENPDYTLIAGCLRSVEASKLVFASPVAAGGKVTP